MFKGSSGQHGQLCERDMKGGSCILPRLKVRLSEESRTVVGNTGHETKPT